MLLPISEEDKECLEPILGRGFIERPNFCYHIYKVRRGKFNNIKLWVNIDLGTCRTKDLFVTKNNYELVDMEATEIRKLIEDTIDDDPIESEDELDW